MIEYCDRQVSVAVCFGVGVLMGFGTIVGVEGEYVLIGFDYWSSDPKKSKDMPTADNKTMEIRSVLFQLILMYSHQHVRILENLCLEYFNRLYSFDFTHHLHAT